MLLVLRVQRRLSWDEVTRVVAGEMSLSQESLSRRSAALRKKFQRLKEIVRAEIAGEP